MSAPSSQAQALALVERLRVQRVRRYRLVYGYGKGN